MDYVYLAETCIIRIVKVSVHYYVGLVNKHSAHVQFKTYLLARMRAVLRRSATPGDEKELRFPGLTISLDNYTVTLDGKQLDMPPKEIELLFFLASREGKVFTREQLLEQVWGFDFFGDSRTVDVHIKRIREKIGERPEWEIKTVWGVGYKFETAK